MRLNLKRGNEEMMEILKLSVETGADGITITAKTCKEWEDYLKNQCPLRELGSYWNGLVKDTNNAASTHFYRGSTGMQVENGIDDFDHELIPSDRQMNFAFLRIKGIGETGIKIKSTRVITTKRLEEMLVDFSKKFKQFYSDRFTAHKFVITIEAE
jgi:hypothetical protein